MATNGAGQGAAGGGNGGRVFPSEFVATSATANTGSGGGGGSNLAFEVTGSNIGRAGGSGIVIVRYQFQ